MAGIDIFDVDHTITRRSSGSRFIALAIRRGVLPYRLLVVLPWYSLTYKFGFFHLREYADGFPYLRGIARSTLEEHRSRELRDPAPAGHLRRRGSDAGRLQKRRAGKSCWQPPPSTSSSSPWRSTWAWTACLPPCWSSKGAPAPDGFTGTPMFRGEKRQRVLQFLQERGKDPRDCSFHSDSIYDLPLLEAVGRPVAVNPDCKLRRIAQARGWQLIDLD